MGDLLTISHRFRHPAVVAPNFLLPYCLLTLFLLPFIVSPASAGEPLVVVARAGDHLPRLTTAEVTAIYLGETTFVAGLAVHPVDYHRTVPIRDEFLKQVLHMPPVAFDSHWIKTVFRSGGIPPLRALSIKSALAEVHTRQGTVAYVPVSAAMEDTQVTIIWRQTRTAPLP